jgi:hypothetical protein
MKKKKWKAAFFLFLYRGSENTDHPITRSPFLMYIALFTVFIQGDFSKKRAGEKITRSP